MQQQKIIRPLVMNDFCLRQFDKSKGCSSQIDFDPVEFENKINELYREQDLKNGYAPFCKHIFVDNFTNSTTYYQEITNDNKHLLVSEYQSRRAEELAVLFRYFPKDKVQTKKCKYLDIILYSKEQIQKEDEAIGTVDKNADIDYCYGIISVKCQDHDNEIPMEPITMMRNALGKDQGGSGVSMDIKKYAQSVQFYSQNAVII